MSFKNKIQAILTENIKEQDLYLDEPVDLSLGNESPLYSENGQLDSLSLISIIADIEKQLTELFDVKVKLASERDLSVQNSPFSTFGTMVDFIEDKLNMGLLEQAA